jgi:hypothetical protein
MQNQGVGPVDSGTVFGTTDLPRKGPWSSRRIKEVGLPGGSGRWTGRRR